VSKRRRILAVLAVAVVVAAGFAGMAWYLRAPSLVARGPDIRQRCVSLANAIASPDGYVSPGKLLEELERRGVKTPSLPVHSQTRTGGSPRELEQWLRAYTAARKEYDARWDEIQRGPDYASARAAVLARDRADTLKLCAQLPEHS
jgi:hypothetical protein